MFDTIRRKLGGPFTRWYVKRGYKYGYEFDFCSVKAKFDCPWWVKPFLIFFSPSVYYVNAYSKWLIDGLLAGEGTKIEPLSKKKIRGLRRNMPVIDEWTGFSCTSDEESKNE